jgi:hypothetical protein
MSAPTGDFNQFHQEQLEPILRSLEAERQQKTQRFGQITLFSILFGGLFTLILAAFSSALGWLAFLPLGIALLVILIAYGTMTSEWSRLFKWRVLTRLVKFVSPELEYHPQRFISEAEFRQSLLYQRDPDRYQGEDLIEGRVGQTALRLSEVHAEYKTEHYDSKGHRRTTWHTLFRGLFIIADFNKHFSGHYPGAARCGGEVIRLAGSNPAELGGEAGDAAGRAGQAGRPRLRTRLQGLLHRPDRGALYSDAEPDGAHSAFSRAHPQRDSARLHRLTPLCCHPDHARLL